jgi:DNA-binding NarL/FixJ family response regulator
LTTTGPDQDRSTAAVRPRVLLVDDNEAMLARAAAALSASCDLVGTARDGIAAIEAAAALAPDVIVLDISMPAMSGLEAATVLRDSGSTAAVIFLTVHEEDEFMTVARSAGGLGYVVKPRLALDLAAAVHAAYAGLPFQSPRNA